MHDVNTTHDNKKHSRVQTCQSWCQSHSTSPVTTRMGITPSPQISYHFIILQQCNPHNHHPPNQSNIIIRTYVSSSRQPSFPLSIRPKIYLNRYNCRSFLYCIAIVYINFKNSLPLPSKSNSVIFSPHAILGHHRTYSLVNRYPEPPYKSRPLVQISKSRRVINPRGSWD